MKEGAGGLFGVYRAQVTATSDPASRGRVKVRVPAVTGGETPRWALVATNAPAKGDTVVVAFEGGDINAPIVLGGLWSDARPPTQKP